MLFLLLLSLTPTFPESGSYYLINPTLGFFEADWRAGPAFPILYNPPKVSGIPVKLLEDPSLISFLGFENSKMQGLDFNPLFFKEKRPATLLFSERGTADLTHLGFLFGAPLFKDKWITFALDSRYFSPEYMPVTSKIQQFTLSSNGDLYGKDYRFFLLRSVREGVTGGDDGMLFSFLRLNKNFTFSYMNRWRSGFPDGKTLLIEGGSHVLQGAKGGIEVEWRGVERLYVAYLNVGTEVQIDSHPLHIRGVFRYDHELGFGPNLGLELSLDGWKVATSIENRSLPFAFRNSEPRWERRRSLSISWLPSQLSSVSLSLSKIINLITFKSDGPEQIDSGFYQLELRSEISKKLGPIDAGGSFIYQFLTPKVDGLRSLNLRLRLGGEKDLSSAKIKVKGSLVVDYFGSSRISSQFLTSHIFLDLLLFDAVDIAISAFNLGDKIPEYWPYSSFPGRTVQVGISLLLWD
jgi:hypothetical protein